MATPAVPGWRPGAVAITGATGQVGRALQRRLDDLPNRVVPLAGPADLTAVPDVEVVVHLAGTLQPRRPNTYVAANLETARATSVAVRDTQVQRIVFLSFLTADAASSNAYLRLKAEAASLLEGTGVPTVVLRCGHIYGPPHAPGPMAAALLARRGRITVLGTGTQRITPIFLGDVVEAIARAALDPATPAGTFPLAGPETFTLDEFARALNRDRVTVRHLPPLAARILGRVLPTLPAPLVDVLLHDAVAPDGVADTVATFGVEPRRLREVWSQGPGRPEPA